MTDFDIARANMVESQIRPNGVTDSRIIAAMARIPREKFVPEDRTSLAYMDEDIRLSNGGLGGDRYLMEPMALARLLQLAEVRAGDLVLDVGCATGYSTAVLAELAQSVIGVETDPGLATKAGDVLAELGVGNAAVVAGPHHEGHAKDAPYDVIVIEGRVETVPAALTDQLRPGGRLVCVMGGPAAGRAVAITRSADGKLATRNAFNATVAAVPGFAAPEPGFVF